MVEPRLFFHEEGRSPRSREAARIANSKAFAESIPEFNDGVRQLTDALNKGFSTVPVEVRGKMMAAALEVFGDWHREERA